MQNKGQKSFVSSPQCLKGEVDLTNPSQIKWSDIPHHSGTAYYRMAATGSVKTSQVVFAGGSDNPYNYDGIGYDGVPSIASSKVFSFDLKNNVWKFYQDIPANMDHRALLRNGEDFYIVGGMQSNQEVSDKVIKFKLLD
jgi:N-acetylneuraminic acid mutarotase